MKRICGLFGALGQDCPLQTELVCLLTFLFTCLPVPAGAGVADGLQLHIEFENNVLDSSANVFDGQASGGLQYVPGVIGQAASFDGVDDQVLFPTFQDALLSQNDFTIAFWFNIPADEGFSILGKRAICARAPFLDIRTGHTSPNVSLEVSNSAQNYFPGVTPKPAGWHHVVFTRAGTKYESFFNGQPYTTGTTGVSVDMSNTAMLGLSNSPCVDLDGTSMLMGQLDDLRIYDRVLTGVEIADLAGLVFADTLESGDTSAWSSSVQ